MNDTPPTASRTGARRRALALAGGASLVAAAGATALLLPGAGADPISTDVPATCSILGTSAAVTVPVTFDDLVDPVAPGGQETLHVDQGLGELPTEVTVNEVVVTMPLPAAVASTDSVSFEGGNMTGSYELADGNLVVTYTGPQSSSQLQFPRMIVDQTIADDASGTIEWKVFSSLVADTNYGTANCTPDDPTTNLNTTEVAADQPPATGNGDGNGDGNGSGDGSTTVPPTTTPPVTTPDTTSPPTTPPTTVPGSGAGGPGVSVCVEVTSPVPVPLPLPCPVTIPPADGGLPVPVPGGGSGGGLPLPLPGVGDGGTPPSLPSLPSLPAPGDGLPLPGVGDGGLPLPAPGGDGGGISVTVDGQIGVSL